MHMPFARALPLTSLVLALGCGGAQPPPKAGGDLTPGAGQTLAEGPAPDLSPVPAPSDLIVIGRLKNPGKLADTALAWAKLPVDWRRMAAEQEPGIDEVLHYDAPVEVAVALDPTGKGDLPQPFAVVSVGLRSLDRTLQLAKKHGEPVRQVRAGVYRVGSGELSCAVAASVGPAPARLVCGDRAEDVDALLPYATRGLPNETLGDADLHVEFRAEPLRRKYARELRQLKTLATPFALKELSLDDPRFDRALADTVHAVTDELLALAEDVDRIKIDLKVNESAGMAEGSFAMKFRGSSSWSVATLIDAGKRSAVAPDAFWKLPKDAAVASYSVGANAKRYDGIRKNLAELLDGFLAHENVPRRVRDQLVEIVEQMWVNEGMSVYARGELPFAKVSEAERTRADARRSIGWHVMGIDDSPKKLKSYLDKIVRAYNDAQLKGMLKKRLGLDAKEIPTLKSRGGRGLPAGSTVYELTLPGKYFEHVTWDEKTGKEQIFPGKPLVVVVALVPDGERTWLGVSADEALLAKKLASVKSADTANQVGSKAGLGTLKTRKAVSQGYFNVAGFMESVRAALMNAGDDDGKVQRVMNAMPHHGETPIIQALTVSGGAAPEVAVTFWLPKEVVEDVAAMAPAVAAQMAGGALGGPMMGPMVPMPEAPPAPPPPRP